MLPIICLRLPGTRDIRYSLTRLFFTSICPLLITFATKLYPRSETYISHKFYAEYHQKGNFLFVRRKRHARVRSVFFRLSHGAGRHFTYKLLVVISGQTGFAVKIALECLSKVS